MYKFARIDLSKTNYNPFIMGRVVEDPNPKELLEIYRKYCVYKKFEGPYPYYPEHFCNGTKVIGYYDENKMIAWSLYDVINDEVVDACQFAWDYANPEYRLGDVSMKHECWYWKKHGYKYIILGHAQKYKEGWDGYEILPTME